MATIFDLSVDDLYSLAVALLPGHKEQLNPEDQVTLRTRVGRGLIDEVNRVNTLSGSNCFTDKLSFGVR